MNPIRLTPAQATALRLSARGGLRWDSRRWVWDGTGAGALVIAAATVRSLWRRGLGHYRPRLVPSAAGRAWLEANP